MPDTPVRRDDILRCTQSLIVAGGYNGFSYADISKAVGIRNASIHHHFPTKARLVRELILQYRDNVANGLAQLDRKIPRPLERLRFYVDYWQTCIADGTRPFCVCALLATELPILPDEVAVEVRGHFRTLRDWLVAVLEQGAAEGAIRLHQPAGVEAEIFMASVHGALLSARAYNDPTVFGTVLNPQLARLAGS